MTDLRVQPSPARMLPGPTSSAWNDIRVVAEIAGLPPEFLSGVVPSRDALIATYGTVVPAEMEAMGALRCDIAAAERYAAEAASPGVAA